MNSKYDCFSIFLLLIYFDFRVLLAGAGAIGSEALKMLSLMGVGCHKRGCISVADDDRLEVSNLNRYTLAERNDVGE